MKRLFPALFLALVVALVVASGVASADPPNDFTTGAGKAERTVGPSLHLEEKFAFSAYDEDDSDLTSAARNGHFVYQVTLSRGGTILNELDLKGSVDCVLVSGNQAAFSGPIEKSSSDPQQEGAIAHFTVFDNDNMGPDRFRFLGDSGAATCPLDPIVAFPITSGNILVSDAP
jgi:hypothetical protein